jgi:ATP-dependent DNA ligase
MTSPRHAYEVRWEGARLLAGLEGRVLRARLGSGQDAAAFFPELRALRAACEPRWALFDGEMVALQDDRASPALLRQRLRLGPDALGAVALTYVVYDVLRIGDSWLLDVPWEERREILTQVLGEHRGVRIAPVCQEGAAAAELCRMWGLGSILAKRLQGNYHPGEMTRDWLAIRPRPGGDAPAAQQDRLGIT